MITLTEIFVIILIHWVADFVLQTDKQAKGKSKNWNDLLSHTLNYSYVWVIIGIIYSFIYPEIQENYKWVDLLIFFPLITFIAHTITDYFTSRLNSKLWAKGKVHYFFVSVGFDQVLHYIQLFLTYYYLKQL
jgi:hypothetical protein